MPATQRTQTRSRQILAALGVVDTIATRWIHLGMYVDGGDVMTRATVVSKALVAFESDSTLLSDRRHLATFVGRTARAQVRDYWREYRMAMSRRVSRMSHHRLAINGLASEPEPPEPWEIGIRAAADEARSRLSPTALAAWSLRRIENLGPREIAYRLDLDADGFEALFTDTLRALKQATRAYWDSFDQDREKIMTERAHDESPTPAELAAEENLVWKYTTRTMSEAEADAFEALLEEDEGMFERHGPFLSMWTSEPVAAELEIVKEMNRAETAYRLHRQPLERRAVLVTPRQPYYDWLETLGGDGAAELKFEAADSSRWPRVFLTPSHLEDKSTDRFIDERMPQLFEALLLELDRRDAWPTDRSAAAFRQWFKVTYADDVDDLVTEFWPENGEERV